jgi:Zn-dependent M28 family amino/carboxypeptidase
VADAFSALPQPPPRSIVFVAVTGEEFGLVGAEFFAHHPTVPAGQIVANINIDEVAIWYDLRDVVAYGSEHSTIAEAVKSAASRFGVEISPDPMPEECFFIRSDQYAFVCQGIPAVWVAAGTKTGDPELDGAAIMSEWLQTRYHSPKDDIDQPIDFKAAAKHAQLYFLIGHEVASDPERPAWNSGDFFGEKFGQGGE